MGLFNLFKKKKEHGEEAIVPKSMTERENPSPVKKEWSIARQEKQINEVQAADDKYAKDKDLDWIIAFWEEIWQDGGPIFEGSGWMFRLPDLYIKAKRYDDALFLVEKIKKTRGSYYFSKAERYIEKIEEHKKKS